VGLGAVLAVSAVLAALIVSVARTVSAARTVSVVVTVAVAVEEVAVAVVDAAADADLVNSKFRNLVLINKEPLQVLCRGFSLLIRHKGQIERHTMVMTV
jgi:glycerol-3-phosphate acyltransferase PlsY